VDFESLIENLSVRAKRVLMEVGVKETDALIRLTRDDLIRAWSCGKKTIAEIEALQSKLQPHNDERVTQAKRDTLDFDNAPKEIIDAVLGVLSVRGAHVLEDLGIDSLKAYMRLDRGQLLKCQNCGRKTADEILRIQAGITEFALANATNCGDYDPIQLLSAPCLRATTADQTNRSNQKGFFADVENPGPWLDEWIRGLTRSKGQARAFMLRKGMLGCAAMTLDRVGEHLGGLTRQRARHLERALENRAATQFQQRRLRPLIYAAAELVRQRGGLVALDELTLLYLL
jgi:hypothetical protein